MRRGCRTAHRSIPRSHSAGFMKRAGPWGRRHFWTTVIHGSPLAAILPRCLLMLHLHIGGSDVLRRYGRFFRRSGASVDTTVAVPL